MWLLQGWKNTGADRDAGECLGDTAGRSRTAGEIPIQSGPRLSLFA